MRHFAPFITTALIAASPAASQAATDYVVEAPGLQQLVQLTAADLRSPDRMSLVESRIRAAAKSVCNSQYRGETFYRVVHLCVTGSTADGMRQFSALRARRGSTALSATGLALVIRPVAD